MPFSDNLLKKFCILRHTTLFSNFSPPLSRPKASALIHSSQGGLAHLCTTEMAHHRHIDVYSWGGSASSPSLLRHLQFGLTKHLQQKSAGQDRLAALEGLAVAWRRQTWTGLGNRILLPLRGNFSTFWQLCNTRIIRSLEECMTKFIQFCYLLGEQAVLLITISISPSVISQPGFLTVTLFFVYFV